MLALKYLRPITQLPTNVMKDGVLQACYKFSIELEVHVCISTALFWNFFKSHGVLSLF